MNISDPVHLKTSTRDACRAIGSKLHLLELGNEFNLAPVTYRSSSNYSIKAYVHEWNTKAESLRRTVQNACGNFPGLMAPSFFLLDNIDVGALVDGMAGQSPIPGASAMYQFVNATNTAEKLYKSGYDDKNLTKELCFHR